jgi:hypothetical protein
MNITLTIEERERLAYIEGHPDAGLLGAILAARDERDAMEEELDAMEAALETALETAEAELSDALDRLGVQ